MKITKSLLAQIIKEELKSLNENDPPTEDPAVNELIGMLDFTIEMKVEELKEDYPDKYTAAQMAEAMKWLINHHWGNPPKELTGQAALQEIGGRKQTPIKDMDRATAQDTLRNLLQRAEEASPDRAAEIQKTIDKIKRVHKIGGSGPLGRAGE